MTSPILAHDFIPRIISFLIFGAAYLLFAVIIGKQLKKLRRAK